MQYPVGQFAKKSWKYLLWFLVNSTRPTKQRYSHLDFCRDVVLGLIAGFSSHKHKAETPAYEGPVMPLNEATHDSVHMGLKQTRRCKSTPCKKWVGKIQCMDANCVVYTFVRRFATVHTITSNIKIQNNVLFLFIFLLKKFVFSVFFLIFFLKIKTFNFWGIFTVLTKSLSMSPEKLIASQKTSLK